MITHLPHRVEKLLFFTPEKMRGIFAHASHYDCFFHTEPQSHGGSQSRYSTIEIDAQASENFRVSVALCENFREIKLR